jgi:hypothetical protein
MTLVIDGQAPPWAQDMARRIDEAITAQRLGPFVSFNVYDAAGDLPDPATNANKIILLSNGTSWIAQSNGADWVYTDGTTV